VLTEEIEDYREAKRNDCRSPSLRARLKGYTGLSEFAHIVVCSRRP